MRFSETISGSSRRSSDALRRFLPSTSLSSITAASINLRSDLSSSRRPTQSNSYSIFPARATTQAYQSLFSSSDAHISARPYVCTAVSRSSRSDLNAFGIGPFCIGGTTYISTPPSCFTAASTTSRSARCGRRTQKPMPLDRVLSCKNECAYVAVLMHFLQCQVVGRFAWSRFGSSLSSHSWASNINGCRFSEAASSPSARKTPPRSALVVACWCLRSKDAGVSLATPRQRCHGRGHWPHSWCHPVLATDDCELHASAGSVFVYSPEDFGHR